MATNKAQNEIRSVAAEAGAHAAIQSDTSLSIEETASMLDEKLYHMIYVSQQIISHAQQVITIGQQGRSEMATLRYIFTIVLQKYRNCKDAYKALHERHKKTTAELERLKGQNIQEVLLSAIRDNDEVRQAEAKVALFDGEKQELKQGETNSENNYRNDVNCTETRIQSQEEGPKSSSAGEHAYENLRPSTINIQALKRERETDESQQEEEPIRKSRKRSTRLQK